MSSNDFKRLKNKSCFWMVQVSNHFPPSLIYFSITASESYCFWSRINRRVHHIHIIILTHTLGNVFCFPRMRHRERGDGWCQMNIHYLITVDIRSQIEQKNIAEIFIRYIYFIPKCLHNSFFYRYTLTIPITTIHTKSLIIINSFI